MLPRVALICDLLEEKWPSMDLVAEMLLENLEQHHAAEFAAARLCPSMRPYVSRTPGLKSLQSACNLDRLLNRFVDYPRWLRRRAGAFDLFHIIDHSYSQLVNHLPPERTVVTCHDLDTFRCLLEPDREKRPRWFRSMTRKILDGFQRSAHVIAVSKTTRNELLRHALFPPERISVVPNGVHPSCSADPDPAADAEVARLLPDRGPAAIWMLNVGSAMPRKRMDVLLRVLAVVRQKLPDVRLIRVGGPLSPAQLELARQLRVDDALVLLPHLTRRSLAAAYRRADLLLHTADAEGFGLPVIEAMACGCPVVASDIPVLREVGGRAATFCPVGDIDNWQAAIKRLLSEKAEDSGAWELRRNRGIAQGARFSWAGNARATADVYRKVIR